MLNPHCLLCLVLNIFNVSHQDAKKGGGVAAIIRGAALLHGGDRLGPGWFFFGHHFVNMVLVQPPSYFLPPMSPCLSYNIPTMMEPTCVFKDPMSSPAESTMTLPPD